MSLGEPCGTRTPLDAAPLVTFIIPLRSRHTCIDWDAVSSACRGTIASIMNQDSDRWRCILVCHESPPSILSDTRLRIINVSLPIPSDIAGYRADKRAKLRIGIHHYESNPTRFYMILDADDRVHRSLTSYLANKNEDNFLITKGYVYNGSKFVRRHDGNFDKLCGSVSISNIKDAKNGIVPLFFGHYNIRNSGLPVHEVSFFAAVKNVAYGGNKTSTRFLWSETPQRTLRKLIMMRPLSARMKADFALDTYP